jgi:hypothetical protein
VRHAAGKPPSDPEVERPTRGVLLGVPPDADLRERALRETLTTQSRRPSSSHSYRRQPTPFQSFGRPGQTTRGGTGDASPVLRGAGAGGLPFSAVVRHCLPMSAVVRRCPVRLAFRRLSGQRGSPEGVSADSGHGREGVYCDRPAPRIRLVGATSGWAASEPAAARMARPPSRMAYLAGQAQPMRLELSASAAVHRDMRTRRETACNEKARRPVHVAFCGRPLGLFARGASTC